MEQDALNSAKRTILSMDREDLIDANNRQYDMITALENTIVKFKHDLDETKKINQHNLEVSSKRVEELETLLGSFRMTNKGLNEKVKDQAKLIGELKEKLKKNKG